MRRTEAVVATYGIPPGGHTINGRLDRRSVYAGPTTTTLYNKLERAFGTDQDPRRTQRKVRFFRENCAGAEPYYSDVTFCTEVVLREHDAGLAAHGRAMVPDTFSYGGIDHLGGDMARMDFLPRETRRRWQDLGVGQGCEPNGHCHDVHPASIPRGDEFLAYASTLRLKEGTMRSRVQTHLGEAAGAFLHMNLDQLRGWTQLAFARPNGFEYEPARGPSQLGQRRAGMIPPC